MISRGLIGIIAEATTFARLLLNMQGAPASTTFTDLAKGGASNPHAITANNSAAVTQAVNDPFGNNVGVLQCTRATDDDLSAVADSDFDPGSADFVVECWINPDAVTAGLDYAIVSNDTAGGNGWRLYLIWNGNNSLAVDLNGVNVLADSVDFVAGSWVHVAFSRSGGTINLYKGGSRVDTAAFAPAVTAGGTLYVGGSQGNANFAFDGKISNVRVRVGTDGGYTGATITVPTAPFTS